MHSSMMHTARSLTVSCSIWGVYLPGVYLPGGCTCLGVYLPGGGVPAWGVYLPGGYLVGGVPAQGVPTQWDVPAWGCTCQGVYLPRGYLPWIVPVPGGSTCPGTPPCEQNSWHMLLKILPCPNFVAGGNYSKLELSLLVNFLSYWGMWSIGLY